MTFQRKGAKTGGSGGFISALGVVQICSWGSLFYSFPPIAEAMGADLGWRKSDIYGAVVFGLVLSAAAAFPVGAAIDRGLGRSVMAGAFLIAGVLLSAWSQVDDLLAFYIVFAALGALHAATLYEPAFAIVTRRYGSEAARRGVTTLTLWGGFASTVFIPLTQFLIDLSGWRGALLVLGLVNAVVCMPLCLLVIDPAKDRAPESPSPATNAGLVPAGHLMRVLRRPVFWALAVALVAYSATFSALTFHLYPLLLERGLTAALVVAILAVIGPAQVLARIVVWLFAPGLSVRLIGSVSVILFPIAVLGFAFAPTGMIAMSLAAFCFGAANGLMAIVRGMMVPEMIGREAYGSLNGALVGPARLALAFAPLGAAWLWERDGDYDGVLVAVFISATVLCLSFWAAVAMSKKRYS
jgi:MFS family permease